MLDKSLGPFISGLGGGGLFWGGNGTCRAKSLFPPRPAGGGTAAGPCVAKGGGGPEGRPPEGAGFIIFDMNPENPGADCDMEFTVAF